MRVLIHLRSDYETKPGGDISLARQYGALLAKSGADVVFTGKPVCEHSYFDIALTFNLDRPFEPAQFVMSCNAKGVPVFLYALHHPMAGVQRYLRKGVSGLKGLIAKLVFFNPAAYETCLTLVKIAVGQVKIHSIPAAAFLFSAFARHYLLNNAARILVSNPLELRELSRQFNVTTDRMAVVPHVLDFRLLPHTAKSRDIDVICAGRIECRKNQLTVAKLAHFFPTLKFVFVGSASPSEKPYFERFTKEIAGLPNVQHIHSLHLAELRGLFQRSRVFICLSWFEVVSLTEMEALASGCRLIISKYSYSRHYTGVLAEVVDPADLKSAERAIHAQLAKTSEKNEWRSPDNSPELAEMLPEQIIVSFGKVINSLKDLR